MILLLLLLAAVALWMVTRSTGRTFVRRRAPDGITDPDELAAAEEEVRELDAFTRPEDADDQLPDWGPGAGPR